MILPATPARVNRRSTSSDAAFAAVPPGLAALPRWLPWAAAATPGGRVRKVPLGPRTGRPADHRDPANLSPLPAALAAARRLGAAGVGFSVPAGGGVVAVDLDGCRDPLTHAVTPAASEILDRLHGTYAEASPSGRGLRLFAAGDLDPLGRRRGKLPGSAVGGLELYDGRQFVTVTGDRLPGRPAALADHATTLWELQRQLGPPRPCRRPAATGTGVPGGADALLRAASGARNGTKVRRLWGGDAAGYGSPSQALLALANLLAFWTGPDPARLFELMTASPLVAATEAERPKWWSPRPGGPWGLAYIAGGAVRDCRRFHPGTTPASRSGLDGGPAPESSPPPVEVNLSHKCDGLNVEGPLGGPTLAASVAWADAGNAAPGYGPGHRLAAICYRLSSLSPGGVFFLSARAAAAVLGLDHSTAARGLKQLAAGGRPLELVAAGERRPGGKAARYRWAGPPPFC